MPIREIFVRVYCPNTRGDSSKEEHSQYWEDEQHKHQK